MSGLSKDDCLILCKALVSYEKVPMSRLGALYTKIVESMELVE